MERAVFLDRDNTLIANDGDLGDPDDVRLMEGVPGGLKSLREGGYRLIVVTNQAGVARGRFTEEDVDSVHQRINALVEEAAHTGSLIDRFYYCPYHPEGTVADYRRDHPWRKPHPGMMLQAAHDMNLDLSRSWAIGDQTRDVIAGRAAGCRTILVTRDAQLATIARPTHTVGCFADAVQAILDQTPMKTADGSADTGADREAEGSRGGANVRDLHRAVSQLTEEVRAARLRRADFTGLRLAALLCQLLALLLALLAVLQLGSTEVFLKWMSGAVLVELATIALLLLDLNR